MRTLIRCYHFLGSIYFAIVLIGFTALFVAAGTFLESATQSHLYAAFYTYRNPAFLAMLALFFVNILFSATRRWPFRKRHLPFLATHLGLLMIIAGTAVKHVYGVQGTMQIAEGSGSGTIALSETRAIRIEKRNPDQPSKRIVGQYKLFSGGSPFPEIEVSIASLYLNSTQSWESWIKGPLCEIAGLDPFPVASWFPETEGLPLGARVRFSNEPAPVWNIYAAYTQDSLAAENQLRNQPRPCLGIFRNKEGDNLLSAFYPDGSHWTQTYRANELGSIFVYDEGFQGYSAFAKLPHATLETPLKAVYRPAPASKKLEENRSMISLRVKKGGREELINLRYDPQGLELAHPILGGEYLLRYTQQTQEIPVRLRLKQARQINYPASDQPYSFECDVWVCGQEKTLSMNNVYETPDGYRFYLANLTSADESAVKRVQLVVNYDPMKYILTYPGGILVSLEFFSYGKNRGLHMENEAPLLYQGRFRPLDSAQLLDTDNPELRCLPNAHHSGEWLPLRALTSASNPTAYSNATFLKLQKLYANLKTEATTQNAQALQNALAEAYIPLAGSPFVQAHGKALFYPSAAQLKAEKLYTHIPMGEAAVGLYATAALFLLVRRRKGGIFLLTLGFIVHTTLLLFRCFILQRPPVANMFETVLYVPWIAVGASYFLARRSKNSAILTTASLFAAGMLLLLKLFRLHDGLDNVQAVLDSQFWLAVHVLMVVGSYGLFALGALIGHLYVLTKNRETLRAYGKTLLQCLYFGVALLIPGTILGGVWAAESWGRFWDWDPKESWAFISSCVYLIWIHAHRFGHITDFGLALGAIIGFQAITFTWYGVNYILGTGLHSYGFGQGGELYYYLFLFIELLFIIGAVILRKRRHEAH